MASNSSRNGIIRSAGRRAKIGGASGSYGKWGLGDQSVVAVIALFGFLNRFNDTMATELEASPLEVGKRVLAAKGWTVGKHAR